MCFSNNWARIAILVKFKLRDITARSNAILSVFICHMLASNSTKSNLALVRSNASLFAQVHIFSFPTSALKNWCSHLFFPQHLLGRLTGFSLFNVYLINFYCFCVLTCVDRFDVSTFLFPIRQIRVLSPLRIFSDPVLFTVA